MPISPLIGRKQIIFPFKKSNNGIGSSAVFSLGNEVWNRTIPIINIDGIAIGFLLCICIQKKANNKTE
jgi:hypothetical protein